MKIEDVVEKFNTTPFLFLGSGITRRYYNLPDWRGLLKHFAYEIKADDFAYSAYENKASKEETPEGLLPKVAELIQIDYDEKWFSDPNIRTLNKDMLIKVKEGLSPFKVEVASYIIFMGYSISDTNIQKIIKSIIDCLDIQQLKILEDRFIFVEYQPGKIGSEVTPYTIMIDDKPLAMKKIVVEDFKLIYKALEGKKSKLPVRILRRFKQELYDFTVTNMPTASMRVASIEDDRVKDEEFVMAIGKYSDYGLRGLHGLKADEWYRNIVIQDIEFSADDLLKYAFNDLMKQNSGRLPVNKYLSEASDKYPECIELARKQNFDYIISATLKKNRNKVGDYKSVMQIWKNEKTSVERDTNLIAHLKEEDINVDELESVLKEIFENDVNVLQNSKSAVRTNVRRLIMIYDYLKWGNKRTS